jgi:hypothetical protein
VIGRTETTILISIMLLAGSLGAGVVPETQVDNEPDPRIEIVPVDSAHSSSIPASLSALSAKIPPGAFLLVNHTGTPITAVDVRWHYPADDGELKRSAITCDAYAFAPLDPIVRANGSSLRTPYECTKEELFPRLATGGILGSPLAPAGKPLAVAPQTTIHIYLDSVIFGDGLISGPDKLQYYLQIQDRYLAVKSFVAEVAAGRGAGEDLPTILARVLGDARSKTDAGSSKSSQRRAYYAGLLQRSPSPEGTIEQLRQQVAPPTFSHIGGSR